MKVKILTEGGTDIGLGHLSRCSSLYDEIKLKGIKVELIIVGDISDIHFLKGRMIKNIDWLSINYLESHISKSDYCMVDSYLATEELYKVISMKAKRAIYIDDYFRISYPKGTIVNPAITIDTTKLNTVKKNIYLYGAKYVILRTPFVGVKRARHSEYVKEVLVTMGGSDIRNLTPVIIESIANKYSNIKFNIIIGKGFMNRNQIENTKLDNVTCYSNVDAKEMRELMTKSDLAITTAGQTIYELIATQTPFIPIKIAENQANNIKSLTKLNLIKNVVDYEDSNFMNQLLRGFDWLLLQSNRNQIMSTSEELIDGLGSRRIVNILLGQNKEELNFSSIKENDCELMYEWANDEEVRKNAFDTKKIQYSDHVKWFLKKMQDKNSRIYIVRLDEIPIGQIRVDIENKVGLIDYSIKSQVRGLGYGSLMLEEIVKVIKNDNSINVSQLMGNVKLDNVASQKSFIKAGYEETCAEEYKVYLKNVI